jgi:hypothetical protein
MLGVAAIGTEETTFDQLTPVPWAAADGAVATIRPTRELSRMDTTTHRRVRIEPDFLFTIPPSHDPKAEPALPPQQRDYRRVCVIE